MSLVQDEPVVVKPRLQLAQLQARARIIERAAAWRRQRKERCATPIGARTREQHGDLAPVDLVADDVEIGRAEWRHLGLADVDQYDQRSERAGLGELLRNPAIEIGRALRSRQAEPP